MARVLGIITIDNKGRASFPQKLRDALGLGEGTQVVVEESDDGRFELIPAELIPRDQLYFHSEEMQRRVSDAESSFVKGSSSRTTGERDTKALLDSLKRF